jgi:hypothetical protein
MQRIVGIMGTLVMTAMCAGAALSAEEAVGEACPQGFVYTSEELCCTVDARGVITDLRTGGEILVKHLYLHGSYKQPHLRFFQGQERESKPLEKWVRDGGVTVLRTGGILTAKDASGATGEAKYGQAFTLSPTRIDVECEVELLTACENTGGSFISIHSLPPETLAMRGYQRIATDGKIARAVFPEGYTKETAPRLGRLQELRVVLPEGHLVFVAGENTAFSLSDTRSYGGKEYRLDVGQIVSWQETPRLFPAGTIFRWSYTIAFERDRPRGTAKAAPVATDEAEVANTAEPVSSQTTDATPVADKETGEQAVVAAMPQTLEQLLTPTMPQANGAPCVTGVTLGAPRTALADAFARRGCKLFAETETSLEYLQPFAALPTVERLSLHFHAGRLYQSKITFTDEGKKGVTRYDDACSVFRKAFGKGDAISEGTYRQEEWGSRSDGKLTVRLTWEEDPGFTYVTFIYLPVYREFLRELTGE